MIKILELKNINLTSLNKKYGGTNRHTGRLFLSKDYVATQKMILLSLKKVNIAPPIRVNIFLESYKDIDNVIHSIINSIQKKGIIKNDRDIHCLKVYKKPLKRGTPDNLYVYAETSQVDYEHQKGLMCD